VVGDRVDRPDQVGQDDRAGQAHKMHQADKVDLPHQPHKVCQPGLAAHSLIEVRWFAPTDPASHD
jgi:hypothetical protein